MYLFVFYLTSLSAAQTIGYTVDACMGNFVIDRITGRGYLGIKSYEVKSYTKLINREIKITLLPNIVKY
jgi:hypothetical protein